MAVVLIKAACWLLTTLTNLVSLLIFGGSARILVMLMQALRFPAGGISSTLGYVGDFVKSLLEYLLEILLDVIKTVISTAFDGLKDGASWVATGATSAVGELGNQMKDRAEKFPEILESLMEMIQTILNDLWDNCTDAIGYVWKNA
uniref:Uncharacterized protein n=1 Tax=Nelumbo nucifera TaxID=4432 RepID=A0A822Z6G6_NELNU|nr:TPA_asm: hypothetical protein HUJ06_007759 [Nelumbo nucifera]